MAKADNFEQREVLLEKLTDNLPTLRVKLGITQLELADIIGIGR